MFVLLYMSNTMNGNYLCSMHSTHIERGHIIMSLSTRKYKFCVHGLVCQQGVCVTATGNWVLGTVNSLLAIPYYKWTSTGHNVFMKSFIEQVFICDTFAKHV